MQRIFSYTPYNMRYGRILYGMPYAFIYIWITMIYCIKNECHRHFNYVSIRKLA